MKLIQLILICLSFTSCTSNYFSYHDITKLNTSVTLEEAKSILKDYYDADKNIKTKTIDDKSYTVINIYRKTKIINRTETADDNINGFLLRNRDQYDNSRINVTKYSRSLFYVIYEGNNFLFAGYGYELRSSPKRNLLISILEKTDD